MGKIKIRESQCNCKKCNLEKEIYVMLKKSGVNRSEAIGILEYCKERILLEGVIDAKQLVEVFF